MVSTPIVTSAPRNTDTACGPASTAPNQPEKVLSSAAATLTPRLMPSICTIDIRLLPLDAWPGPKSLSVTVFIAVNCIELTAPNAANCRMRSQSGCEGVISAKLAIIRPSASVLNTSTRR